MDLSVRKIESVGIPFNGWRIINEIGSGSFGSVFRIESARGDVCALKVIPVPYNDSDLSEAMLNCGGNAAEARRSFDDIINTILEREIGTAQACSSCRNVIRIYEKAVVDDPSNQVQRYIMVRMELLMDSKSRFLRPDVTQGEIVQMMRDIATALAFMEGRRIIHRDIKPANIMLDGRGVCKLTDFGEARVMKASGTNTISKGTPYYMAPEVYNSRKYDHRADIYSLGIVAYYFLNGGTYPLVEGNVRPREAWSKRMQGATCPAIRGVSDALNRVIHKCVAFNPSERYASAVDLLKDLERLGSHDHARITNRANSAPVPDQGDNRSEEQVNERKPLPTGAIVGIVLGSVFGFWMIILLIVLAVS